MTTRKKTLNVIRSLRVLFRCAMFNYKGSIAKKELSEYFSLFKRDVEDLFSTKRLTSDLTQYDFLRQVVKDCDAAISVSDFQGLARLSSDARIRLSLLTGQGESENDFEIMTDDRSRDQLAPVSYDLQVVLDNIRSPFNVGGFFRTGDAVRVKKIHLCGMTPTPDNIRVKRSAMGADTLIPWEHARLTEDCVSSLKGKGYKIFCIETVKGSIPFQEVCFSKSPETVMVFGNEEFGISHAVLEMADDIVSLPMMGMKNSLNVTVTGGIVLYGFLSSFSKGQSGR